MTTTQPTKNVKVLATLDDDSGSRQVTVCFTSSEYAAIERDQTDGNQTAMADAISDKTGFCVLSIDDIKL